MLGFAMHLVIIIIIINYCTMHESLPLPLPTYVLPLNPGQPDHYRFSSSACSRNESGHKLHSTSICLNLSNNANKNSDVTYGDLCC